MVFPRRKDREEREREREEKRDGQTSRGEVVSEPLLESHLNALTLLQLSSLLPFHPRKR